MHRCGLRSLSSALYLCSGVLGQPCTPAAAYSVNPAANNTAAGTGVTPLSPFAEFDSSDSLLFCRSVQVPRLWPGILSWPQSRRPVRRSSPLHLYPPRAPVPLPSPCAVLDPSNSLLCVAPCRASGFGCRSCCGHSRGGLLDGPVPHLHHPLSLCSARRQRLLASLLNGCFVQGQWLWQQTL
jgi:hypothetical protein